MIPFLVADRPISLSILKGVSLPPEGKIGIMGQAAATTANFKRLFASYPFGVEVMYPNGQPSDAEIARRTVRMVDSGIFGKRGCQLGYADLFAQYEAMHADYGIMIDVLRDEPATLRSAEQALAVYAQRERPFVLVGVAQGQTLTEYLRCFERLLALGFRHIAIGGLLRKRDNTARYAYVRSGELMEEVLSGVRRSFGEPWLFVLGAFHPKRRALFGRYRVWGSDYKGWLFNYAKKAEVLDAIRGGRLARHPRIALPELGEEVVTPLTDQALRFWLTRSFVERRVLDAAAHDP